MTDSAFVPDDPAPSGPPNSPGDAANVFLSGLFAGPVDSKAAEKMRTAGSQMKTLAQEGAFAINEAGFQAYMKACDFFLHGFDSMSLDLQLLSQEAQMGSSDYAGRVATFNTQVANGDNQSMLPNLNKMKIAVETAR
ncbi:hypothetical protein [Amycolatopsis benzoatilytica]|uniref:hypothetical protein n=1 Tax=Amycolatopsis benzoatilytica TaxID=346045 RepID=UPI001FE05401|nr:hypothetical protein [Amycolatopsis benzoatilytica]